MLRDFATGGHLVLNLSILACLVERWFGCRFAEKGLVELPWQPNGYDISDPESFLMKIQYCRNSGELFL